MNSRTAAPPQVGTRTRFCVGGQYLEEVDNGEDYENRREENARQDKNKSKRQASGNNNTTKGERGPTPAHKWVQLLFQLYRIRSHLGRHLDIGRACTARPPKPREA